MSARIGTVPYLNARPLVADLDGVDMVTDVPSALVQRLRDGELDAALASAVEVFRRPALSWLAGPAIASRGAVGSVLLFLRTEPAEVKTLELDPSSRTGAAMARVCLEEFHGVSPHVVESDADATLRIGDPALAARDGRTVLDLGEVWAENTGLPFVYALWLLRPGVDAKGLATTLRDAAATGLERREALAAEHAAASGWDPELCRAYLCDTIRFEFGDDERKGLQLFGKLAAARGLVDHAELPEPAA